MPGSKTQRSRPLRPSMEKTRLNGEQSTSASPTWIGVDRLMLLHNGEVVDTVEGTRATFSLDSESDATYVVVAEGDAAMSPVSSTRPWAMTSALLYDAEGDGWIPPLPPLGGRHRP